MERDEKKRVNCSCAIIATCHVRYELVNLNVLSLFQHSHNIYPRTMPMAAKNPVVFFTLLLLVVGVCLPSSLAMSSSKSAGGARIIDSHLHVWANSQEAERYPYEPGQEPPASLVSEASYGSLLEKMDESGVGGALIVQPINHKFDHQYVTRAIKEHPSRLKGMLLHDPSLGPTDAVERLEQLALAGFVGVRFNPYLWPEGGLMSAEGGSGLDVYRRCGELLMPVGVMCFKGLELHYDDIVKLIEASPATTLVLDHMGFCSLDQRGEAAFKQLLSLAKYDNVVVKISALFRVAGGDDSFPYAEVKYKRFQPLLEAYGPDRLMFGSDFPFVIEKEGRYGGAVDVVRSWLAEDRAARDAVMGGTAERLFGPWGAPEKGKGLEQES